MARRYTGGKIVCAFGYEGCYEKHGTGVKIPRKMTDEEAGKVVLPALGIYSSKNSQGRRATWSDGSGKLHVFPEDKGFGSVQEATRRYLESVGAAPNCCTVWEPCDRHRGALRGRDWKTGEYK